jgi:hypothetical protein
MKPCLSNEKGNEIVEVPSIVATETMSTASWRKGGGDGDNCCKGGEGKMALVLGSDKIDGTSHGQEELAACEAIRLPVATKKQYQRSSPSLQAVAWKGRLQESGDKTLAPVK